MLKALSGRFPVQNTQEHVNWKQCNEEESDVLSLDRDITAFIIDLNLLKPISDSKKLNGVTKSLKKSDKW